MFTPRGFQFLAVHHKATVTCYDQNTVVFPQELGCQGAGKGNPHGGESV